MRGRHTRRFSTWVHHLILWWAIHSSPKEQYNGIQLLSYRNDETFFEKTRQALTLIRDKDPLNYRRVIRSLRMITDLGLGEGYYDPRYQAFHVNQLDLQQESVASYAAAIIHETIHGRTEHCRIPYVGNEARYEYLCTQVQARFLERIGEHRLANIVRSAEAWWSDTARAESRLAFLKTQHREYACQGGLLDRWLSRLYEIMARKSAKRQRATTNQLRQFKRNQWDVLEFDRDGDNKADQWEYYDHGVIVRVEMDSQGAGWIDERNYYERGVLTRVEKLGPDGSVRAVGYFKYRKQHTQKKIYWTTPEGELTTVQYYQGKELVGKSVVKNGVVINVVGQARHNVGDKMVEPRLGTLSQKFE